MQLWAALFAQLFHHLYVVLVLHLLDSLADLPMLSGHFQAPQLSDRRHYYLHNPGP